MSWAYLGGFCTEMCKFQKSDVYSIRFHFQILFSSCSRLQTQIRQTTNTYETLSKVAENLLTLHEYSTTNKSLIFVRIFDTF